ncbi:unnamed protein product [Urochloa humidicola]
MAGRDGGRRQHCRWHATFLHQRKHGGGAGVPPPPLPSPAAGLRGPPPLLLPTPTTMAAARSSIPGKWRHGSPPGVARKGPEESKEVWMEGIWMWWRIGGGFGGGEALLSSVRRSGGDKAGEQIRLGHGLREKR